MKKYHSEDLLNELEADVRQIIATATLLKMEDPGHLLQQPAMGKWSVIQVMEHLNSYGRYYLLEMEKVMEHESHASPHFKPGWLGDYFTRLMRPTENGEIKHKMQAPRNHRPSKLLDAFPVINTFMEQQHYLLNLLDKARGKNIGHLRVPVSIARFIKLKLGDTFRFFIAHEQRHFVQLAKGLEQVKEKEGRLLVTRKTAHSRRFV